MRHGRTRTERLAFDQFFDNQRMKCATGSIEWKWARRTSEPTNDWKNKNINKKRGKTRLHIYKWTATENSVCMPRRAKKQLNCKRPVPLMNTCLHSVYFSRRFKHSRWSSFASIALQSAIERVDSFCFRFFCSGIPGRNEGGWELKVEILFSSLLSPWRNWWLDVHVSHVCLMQFEFTFFDFHFNLVISSFFVSVEKEHCTL